MSGRPLRQIVDAIVSRDLSPEAQSRMAADFARQRLDEGRAHNRRVAGRDVPYIQIVDGSTGVALERVKPENGRIIFRFEVSSVSSERMFAYIAEQLVRHSPRLTGRFSESFVFFAGGRMIGVGEAVPPANEYVFLNTTPYARRIERGSSSQAPSGVFQSVAKFARDRFGEIADIKFTYRSLQDYAIAPYVPVGQGRRRNRARGRFASTPTADSAETRAAAAKERATRVPAIAITFRGEGPALTAGWGKD